MIDDKLKDELGIFEETHKDFDLGNDKIFKGFAICNNKLHVLLKGKDDNSKHPLICEPAEDYLFKQSDFAEDLKELACKEIKEDVLKRWKAKNKSRY